MRAQTLDHFVTENFFLYSGTLDLWFILRSLLNKYLLSSQQSKHFLIVKIHFFSLFFPVVAVIGPIDIAKPCEILHSFIFIFLVSYF